MSGQVKLTSRILNSNIISKYNISILLVVLGVNSFICNNTMKHAILCDIINYEHMQKARTNEILITDYVVVNACLLL